MTQFVDTNILLYVTSRASEEARKRTVALDLLSADNLALSVQVFPEEQLRNSRLPIGLLNEHDQDVH